MNFDYIIIGAGSAGCLLANRISASPKNKVLLLEAGKKDSNPWLHIPIGYYKTMNHPQLDWCYRTLAEAELCNRAIKWPRGKTLGGSSAINGLVYIRGQRQDYDDWAKNGNKGWGYDDVLPYFLKSEKHLSRQNEHHGQNGELIVSAISDRSELCDSFIEAVYQHGARRNDDFNDGIQEGAGYFDVTINGRGLRCSSASAFLQPALSRPNLTVFTKSTAIKIIIDENQKKAIAVQLNQANQTKKILANREIILCAGAIGSPQLLQLSGIGNADLLKKFGIKCIKNLPGVGENLQDHLQIRPVYKTHQKTLNDQINNPVSKMMLGLQYLLKRNGPIATGVSQAGAFVKMKIDSNQSEQNKGDNRPDIQYHFQRVSADHPGEDLHKFSAFTASVCQLRPKSRGYVRIKSARAADYPDIAAKYLSDKYDQQIAVQAVLTTRQIMQQKPIVGMIKNEFCPGDEIVTEKDILQWIRKSATTIYHPVGTCKMGDDKNAVVDQRLNVHGIESLRIVDASIMPTIVSGNTNAPVIMIAEKAADFITQQT